MLKNTKFRPLKDSYPVLIDIFEEVLKSSKRFVDNPDGLYGIRFERDGKGMHSICFKVLQRVLPVRMSLIRKTDKEFVSVVRDWLLENKYTCIHAVLATRPSIYGLYAPFLRIHVWTN